MGAGISYSEISDTVLTTALVKLAGVEKYHYDSIRMQVICFMGPESIHVFNSNETEQKVFLNSSHILVLNSSCHSAIHSTVGVLNHKHCSIHCKHWKLLLLSAFTCLVSFQMTNNLGMEEERRAPVQSLADLEEAIPNSMEKSLAEVSHAPPSATRMAPVT